jgi:uncharacterized protein (TIGR00255 family)
MRSMTGYGRGKAVVQGKQITVELNSVNRKQLEISLNLPRHLSELEPRVRDLINLSVSRGRLTVSVAEHSSAGRSTGGRLNVEAARTYQRKLETLKRQLKLSDPITLETLLRAPGLFEEAEAEVDVEAYWPVLEKALRQALDQLLRMRRKEGAHLAKDLGARLKFMRGKCAGIEKAAPQVMHKHRDGLLARAKNAGLEISPNDERFLKEIVFFADRSDITEELTRLKSHFGQFEELMGKDEPAGRTLDFIIQEMNREINTIGSKANDLDISQAVVALKTELEKVREQVQNIE